MASATINPWQLSNDRVIQNYYLIWLDEAIDKDHDKWQNSIIKLREIVNTINTFANVDQCIDYITDIQETVFIILSGEFQTTLISTLNDISQVNSIYILCENKFQYNKSLKISSEVSGIYVDIASIYDALREAVQDYDHNSFPVSFVKTSDEIAEQKLKTLDCSFMYTQMLKEILLTIDFNQGHFNDFIKYCRERFADNAAELRNVDKIEKEYSAQQAIRWYTYNSFLYSMLNRALRTMEADLIVSMGFFVRDLHTHITLLHTEQYSERKHFDSFKAYRGQGLSKIDLDHLKTTEGGLLAFNNFLSTSLDPKISETFARRALKQSDMIGILFVIAIDPSLSTTPFAMVKDVSYYKREQEVLFSMHSVFRIRSIQQVDKNDRLWEVNLALTSENDPQLKILMDTMKNNNEQETGWFRLGSLLMKIAQFDKAQQVYEILLNQTADEDEEGNISHQLGSIMCYKGNNSKAIMYYEKALKIQQKTLPVNHPDLIISYNNIGSVFQRMGEYSKALSSYTKAMEIILKTLPANHLNLATSYNNIGLVFQSIGEYSKALSSHEKALKIRQKTLPANHPDLAISYNNIGSVFQSIGEYSKALSSYEKALEIQQKTLPVNHPNLAISYNNIGSVLKSMGEYSKALSSYEKAMEIILKILPTNHPNLATSYNNIGLVYDSMGEYSKALSSYEKALKIRQKTLPVNHPDLAICYNNIGLVFQSIGEYSKALSSYENALEIQQKTLPASHPNLAISYNNIGSVFQRMGEYSKALSSYEKAMEIILKILPTNHPNLATSYNNIGLVFQSMGEYSKALSFCEKALKIRQKTLPANHPDLAISYNNIGLVFQSMGEYSKALLSHEKALKIRQNTVPVNHPNLATSYNNIGLVFKSIGEYSKALSFYEKALEIQQWTLPANHPDLAISYNNIGSVHNTMGEYSKALSYCQCAVDIVQCSLSSSHSHYQLIKKNFEIIRENRS